MWRVAGDGWRALRFGILSSVLCLLISCLTGCDRKPAGKEVSLQPDQQPAEKTANLPQDKPLAVYQNELLDLAFETATKIPINPHLTDRSRVQANAVTLCFELDQPQRALRYIEKIGDWRRGEGYADYAFYRVQHGITNDAQHYLKFAEEISAITDQDWGRDRIWTVISKTHTLLGENDLAEKYKSGVDMSESGKVARVEATLCTEETLDTQTQALDALIVSGNFDLVKNALYAYAELFDRFYENTARRSQIEDKIKADWHPLPFFIRIELLMEMSGFALQHADQAKSRELVDEAKTIMDGLAWPAEYYIPMAARLAICRFEAGDEAAARSLATGLLTFYNEHELEILNTDRSKALCSVAEALKDMGDFSAALAVYKQAVDAGAENKNSRPRAEDLSAICLSMLKHQMEPDAALWARIREIKGALGDPW